MVKIGAKTGPDTAAMSPENRLLDRVLQFAACCRASELSVSTAETLDTVNQLRLIDPLDEPVFKTLLGANFVKTRRDRPKFEALYQLFFHDLTNAPDIETMDAPAENESSPNPVSNEIKDIMSELSNHLPDNDAADPVNAALLDFLNGRAESWLGALQQLAHVPGDTRQTPLKSNLGELSQRLEVMLKINRMRARVRQLMETRLTDDPVTREAVERHFQTILDRAYDLFRHEPQPDNAGLKAVNAVEQRFPSIGETPLANLTPAEIESIQDIIDRLVNKLKDVAARRQAARRRGMLDVKATLRLANRSQGVPMKLIYKTRPPKKGKIVTLCDVSGSVWSTARFMLSVLYALQDCFSGVKSFVFVAGVADVSALFQGHDINTAIDKIFSNTRLETEIPTDYGETFLRFAENHMSELTRRTTLIIIGDGRSNYMNPRVDVLNEMRQKCRRVIWLNPESLTTWDTGDSDMRLFQKYCHEIRPCQNLNQLWAFVEDLIL